MTKQYSNLWERITSFGNLYTAWQAASLGKRSKPEVATFELSLEPNLLAVQRSLLSGTYHPSGYHSFLIQDPKRRWVSAAPFLDRVVHHSLIRVLEPIYEPTFIDSSYANRKGRGTHLALGHAQQGIQQNAYVLQCDIKQFFPSVDHAILMSILAKKITCQPTLDLCETILASGDKILADEYSMTYFSGDDLLASERARGLPIGNLTSQFWANVYMNELDQLVKRELKCKTYLRYVDDFLLFSDSKKTLWEWKSAMREKLNSLRLTMHEESSTVYPTKNGIPFLGFNLFATHRRLKNRNARAFEHRYREWQVGFAKGELTLEQITQRVQGWVAHAKHADTQGLREIILSKPWKT